MRTVEIHVRGQRVALIEQHADHVLTTLADGTTSANWTHSNERYKEIAAECGFSEDRLLDYCFEHEVLHSLLPWRCFGVPSEVVRCAAHSEPMNQLTAAMEERLIWYVQHWMVFEEKFCQSADVQWRELKIALEFSRRTEILRLADPQEWSGSVVDLFNG